MTPHWRSTGCTVVVLLAVVAWAEDPATQPTTNAAPSSAQRIEDLVAVIEGPNSVNVRRTVARELLLHDWPATPDRLVRVLNGTNASAQVAVASALVELPTKLDDRYIDPLLVLLGSEDAAVRRSAGAALAAYRDSGVIPRLRAVAADATQAVVRRLSAIDALGRMTRRDALAGLVELLSDADTAVTSAALHALEQAAAMHFDSDAAAAQAWWASSSALSPDVWQQMQIERLVRANQELQTRRAALEARVVDALSAGFQRASEAEKSGLLAAFLRDNLSDVRLLGLELTQVLLAAGRAVPEDLPADVKDGVRALLSSPEARVRAAAVRSTAALRDAADAPRFLDMLATESSADVVRALVNGLGYVADASAVPAVLNVLGHEDESCVTEAVTTLGRLAERDVLGSADRNAVATALLQVFERTAPTKVALRERVLWAMSLIPDPRFASVLSSAIDSSEAVAVRQAAMRGIIALNDPALADALVVAVKDADATVRRSAIEALAQYGNTPKHLTALWERLAPEVESNEALRQTATEAALQVLLRRPATEIPEWLGRISGNAADSSPRKQALIERLLMLARERNGDHERLGMALLTRARLQREIKDVSGALDSYGAALAELDAASAGGARDVAVEYVRYALEQDQLDATVSTRISEGALRPEPAEWLAIIEQVVTPLLQASDTRCVEAMLDALEAHPVPGVPGERLVAWRAELGGHEAATGPATQPAGDEAKAGIADEPSAPAQ